MKALIISVIFLISILIFSCNNLYDNPYDRACPSNIWTPKNLLATINDDKIQISWEETETHFNGFVLEKSTDSLTWQPIQNGLINKSNQSFTDSIPYPATNIYYRLYAVADKNLSGYCYSNAIREQDLAKYGLTHGLVAYYPFNGNANDASGNSYNGTVFGASLTTDRYNNPNSAYSFVQGNYISTTNNMPLTSVSISVWVEVLTSPMVGAFVCKNMDLVNNSGYAFYYGNSNNPSIYNNADNGLFAVVGWGGISANLIIPNPVTYLSLNVWHNCVFTYGSGNGNIYLDGVLISSLTGLNPITQNNQVVLIGKSPFGDNLFSGNLDDIRIYDRILTPLEVLYLANH